MAYSTQRQRLGKQHTSYSQLESRQLLAADFSVAPVTSVEIYTVQPTIDFVEVQWGDETRLAKSGEWLIWQHDDGDKNQAQRELKVGDEKVVSFAPSISAYTGEEQKLEVVDEISSGLFVLTGADDWSYESVAESVGAWIPNAVVEPNFIVNVDAVPNDSDFGDLWGLNNTGQAGGLVDADIDAVEAWDISTGSSDVLVAVIDTGVDYTHPDLVDNIWVNPGEIAGDGIDNDGNGYVDDIHGWDFANDDSDPMDDDGHGTHVAGTIGAVGNNNLGVSGVSQDVTIVAVKFLGENGGTTADAIRSVEYANTLKSQGHNLVLTNNSWGGGGFESALELVIQDALNLDILFVAAAGNSSTSSLSYPAGYDSENIISVAATDRFDQIASFSNFSETWVDVAAPGEGILSTVPGGGYQVFSGTSMASPHVAGALALLAAVEPDLSALELRDQLFERVDILPQLDGLVATSGRLNAFSLIDPAFNSDSDIDFDAASYLTPGTIGINLTDTGGFAPGATVIVESSSGDRETFAVTPAGGIDFSTSINSAVGAANVNDGTLQVASGDTLTVSHFDLDDGFGSPVTVFDTAEIFVDDHGDDAGVATSLDLAFSLSGRTEATSDEDWFSFDAVAGLEYEFEILRGSPANTTLSLYGIDGVSLLEFDGPSLGASISWTAPSAGTYYVAVGQATDGTGAYQFSGAANIPRGTVTFDADIYPVPGTVGLDLTETNGFVAGATVTIEASSGDTETLVITATGGLAFSTSIGLIEGPGNSNDGVLQITSGDELTATYFDSDDGFGGTFTLTDTALAFVDDHGNGASTASPVSIPFAADGEIEHPEDVDWFRFDAVAGSEYEFETTLGSLSDSTLTLYDTDGTTELIFNDDGGDGLASLIRWQAPATGSYYLAVRPFSSFSQFGTYQLLGAVVRPESTVNFDAANYTPPGSVGITLTDPNGFAAGATVTIESSSGDVETLTIAAAGNLEYSASVNLIEGTAIAGDGALQVALGDTLTATYFDIDDGFGGTLTAIDAASIFLDDHGNEASTATLVRTDFEIAGDLELQGERDWFRFNAVAGFDYEFETTLLGLGDSTLTLYDTDGVTELSFNDDAGGSAASLIQWQAPATGSYYLEVQAFAGFGTGTYLLTGSTDQFLLGDTSQDGLVNFLDISPFISLLVAQDYLAEADMDGDGDVDFLDISPFITLLSRP